MYKKYHTGCKIIFKVNMSFLFTCDLMYSEVYKTLNSGTWLSTLCETTQMYKLLHGLLQLSYFQPCNAWPCLNPADQPDYFLLLGWCFQSAVKSQRARMRWYFNNSNGWPIDKVKLWGDWRSSYGGGLPSLRRVSGSKSIVATLIGKCDKTSDSSNEEMSEPASSGCHQQSTCNAKAGFRP